MATTETENGWLSLVLLCASAVLLCASVLLLGRSFWVLYVRGVRTRATVIVTWASLVFMVTFWTWVLLSGGWVSSANGE